MLFGYELRKVCKRVSPLLVLIILLCIAISTMLITALSFNHTPAASPNVYGDYLQLTTKIENWDSERQNEIEATFQDFYLSYCELNAHAVNGANLVTYYQTSQTKFKSFYDDYYLIYIHPSADDKINDYLLIREKHLTAFEGILKSLNLYFQANYTTPELVRQKLPNHRWEDTELLNILDNIYVQTISQSDLMALKAFIAEYPAGDSNYNYTNAYESLRNQYWLAISKSSDYNGKLSEYNQNFHDYVDDTTCQRNIKLAEYRLHHQDQDYAVAFQFGNIFNNMQQVSLFDFLFTNLEMAAIPLMLLVMIWAAATFFTDSYQSTIITSIAACRKRAPLIIIKSLIVLTLGALSLLALTGVYSICGLLFFKAILSPDILCLFNGNQILVFSATNYFVIYFLGLIWKMLPIIAITGLFSFAKSKPQIIIGLTLVIYAAVLLSNALLGTFNFYQFVPCLALDPLRYFGAQLFISPTPTQFNLWYTLPVMALIDVYLYWQLIHNFRRRDF